GGEDGGGSPREGGVAGPGLRRGLPEAPRAIGADAVPPPPPGVVGDDGHEDLGFEVPRGGAAPPAQIGKAEGAGGRAPGGHSLLHGPPSIMRAEVRARPWT